MNIFWFIKQSIVLDFKFLEVSDWNILKKINFLILKYFLISKHFFKKFELGIFIKKTRGHMTLGV